MKFYHNIINRIDYAQNAFIKKVFNRFSTKIT